MMTYHLGFSYYWPTELCLLLGLEHEAPSDVRNRLLATLHESIPPFLRGDPQNVLAYRQYYYEWLVTAWGEDVIKGLAERELDAMVGATARSSRNDEVVLEGASDPEPCPEGFVMWDGECVPYEVHDFPEDVIEGEAPDPYDPEYDFEDWDPCEEGGVCFELDEEGNYTEVDCCPPFLCC